MMPDQPDLVTIVLTTLDSARHVAGSVASCLAQSHSTIELLVIDGGSTDDTLAIVAGFADPRVRVIPQRDNAGKLPGALNLGMAEARGAYITWTQDDCRFEPNAIEVMLEYLRAHPDIGLVYADYWDIDADGQRVRYQRVNPPAEMTETFRDDVVRQCFLFRRAVYEVVGPQETRYFPVHEVPWRLRVAEHFQLAPLHVPLMDYMVHEASLTGRFGPWELQRDVARVLHAAGHMDRRAYRRRRAEIDVDQAYEDFVVRGDFDGFRRRAIAGMLRAPRQVANRGTWKLLAASLAPWRRHIQERANAAWRDRDDAAQRRLEGMAVSARPSSRSE